MLLFQIMSFGNYANAEKTPDFGLQRTQDTQEIRQNVFGLDTTKLVVTTTNGFSSPIDIVIKVDPKDSGVDARINGKTSLKIDSKKDNNLGISVSAESNAPTGEYKVTITGTGTVNGKKIIRETFFIVKVKGPSEFFIEAKPTTITIPQGGVGSTTIKTTATKSFQNSINLEVWFKSLGFSSKFSGDGELTMDMISQTFSDWYITPKKDKPTNTKLDIKVSPYVAPGTYKASVLARMQDVEFGAPQHTIPLVIKVTADPKYAHLQDPTAFDIEFERKSITVEQGATDNNDIKIWSDRPDEQISFDVTVDPAGKGVSAGLNEKRIIPNKMPALGSFVIVAVSKDAEPGTYTVVLTGKTTTLSGKELTQITSFDVIVPKNPKTIKKPTTETSELKNQLKELYQTSKSGEKLASMLKKANDEESKTLKKLSGDAKSIHSKTKNSDAKKLSDKIQGQIKDAEADKKQISAIDAGAKKTTKQILAIAKENKITKSELEKPSKDSKTDAKNPKPDQNSVGSTRLDLDTLDKLAKILFDAKSHNEEEAKKNEADIRKQLEDIKSAREAAEKNSENKSDQKDPNAPPESVLDDLDPTIRGPDVNEPKPEPKIDKPKTDQQNTDAPPESILDDVETDSGPDARAPKEKPKQGEKPKQDSSIDHARIAQDDMRIIEESLKQELLDQIRDTQLKIELERQLKDLKQKVVIEDTKKPIIQKDPIKLPETKTDNKPKSEVKPKSTVPEKTEKPMIQKDPIITEPKPSNTKPTLSIPKQVTYEATGPGGANVPFTTSSNDKEDGSLTPTCNPSSGSLFPIGATSVSCSVTDSNGNSVSGAFTVTVMDRTPPAFAPFQPTEGVRDDTGVQVFFDVTANDLVDGNVPVSCNYQSGYKFPPGVTELQCTASDSRGNQSTKTVQITVTVTES
jgi:hypothetical protein